MLLLTISCQATIKIDQINIDKFDAIVKDYPKKSTLEDIVQGYDDLPKEVGGKKHIHQRLADQHLKNRFKKTIDQLRKQLVTTEKYQKTVELLDTSLKSNLDEAAKLLAVAISPIIIEQLAALVKKLNDALVQGQKLAEERPKEVEPSIIKKLDEKIAEVDTQTKGLEEKRLKQVIEALDRSLKMNRDEANKLLATKLSRNTIEQLGALIKSLSDSLAIGQIESSIDSPTIKKLRTELDRKIAEVEAEIKDLEAKQANAGKELEGRESRIREIARIRERHDQLDREIALLQKQSKEREEIRALAKEREIEEDRLRALENIEQKRALIAEELAKLPPIKPDRPIKADQDQLKKEIDQMKKEIDLMKADIAKRKRKKEMAKMKAAQEKRSKELEEAAAKLKETIEKREAFESPTYKEIKLSIRQDKPLINLTKMAVNERGFKGLTHLMHAAQFGRTERARELIKAGADVNATTKTGTSALTTAVGHNQHDMATLLIESKAVITEDIKALAKKDEKMKGILEK